MEDTPSESMYPEWTDSERTETDDSSDDDSSEKEGFVVWGDPERYDNERDDFKKMHPDAECSGEGKMLMPEVLRGLTEMHIPENLQRGCDGVWDYLEPNSSQWINYWDNAHDELCKSHKQRHKAAKLVFPFNLDTLKRKWREQRPETAKRQALAKDEAVKPSLPDFLSKLKNIWCGQKPYDGTLPNWYSFVSKGDKLEEGVRLAQEQLVHATELLKKHMG